MTEDMWQCRHSREGCATDEECRNRDQEPVDLASNLERFITRYGTPLGQRIAEQPWDDLGENEDYERDMRQLFPWNEGIE